MVQYENECMDCATGSYPCIHCGLEHVAHYICDRCHEDTDIYEFEGEELCIECIEKLLVKVGE